VSVAGVEGLRAELTAAGLFLPGSPVANEDIDR